MSGGLTHAAVALIWVAALSRLVITVLDRTQSLYRWSFTVGVLGVAIGSLGFAYPEGVARLSAIPMLGTLIAHLGITVAAGAVAIYVLTLYADRPPYRWLIAIICFTTAVCLVQVITWSTAPIHDRFHEDLAAVPGTAAYHTTHYAPLALYGAWLSGATLLLVRRSARVRDRSRTLGLLLVAVGSLTGAGGMLAYLLRVGRGRTTPTLDAAGDALIVFTAATIGVATVIFLIGPSIERRWDDRALQLELTPLWHALTTKFPQVRLPGPRVSVDRQVIEIHDALTLLTTAPETHPEDPLRAIAHAAQSAQPATTGIAASALLPSTTTHAEDTTVLTALAQAYRQEQQCTQSAPAASRSN